MKMGDGARFLFLLDLKGGGLATQQNISFVELGGGEGGNAAN
jgi:hypothetical protein